MLKKIRVIAITVFTIGVIGTLLLTAAFLSSMAAAIGASGEESDIDLGITGTGEYLWPVPSSKTISSKYGPRYLLGRWEFHTGVDIAAPSGSPIVAADQGTVIDVLDKGAFGKHLIIQHGSKAFTLYAHCSSISAKKGDNVDKGEKIAKVGSTGRSTGPHLHFEIRHINEYGQHATYDPLIYINSKE